MVDGIGLEGLFPTSRTLPTRVFCWSSRVTPLAVFMLVFSILRSFGAGNISSAHDDHDIAYGLPEAILRIWRTGIGLRNWEIASLLCLADA